MTESTIYRYIVNIFPSVDIKTPSECTYNTQFLSHLVHVNICNLSFTTIQTQGHLLLLPGYILK